MSRRVPERSSASPAPLRIVRVPIEHPDAQVLIAAVQEVYVDLYGGTDNTPLEPGYFDPPSGSFFVGYAGDEPVASGAWRFRPDVAEELGLRRPAEIKRMHVLPAHQRRGHARQMLAHLERTARVAGATDLILETGAPQRAAIGLYVDAGYTPIPSFGHYRWSPNNRCFARRLDVGLMLYDADCGFCARSSAQVHRLGARVARASIQEAQLGAFGISEERALVEMPYVHPDGRVEYAHLAWAGIVETGPLPTRILGRLLRAPGIEPLAAAAYRWLSRHRHRLPGGTPSCRLEAPT